MNWIPQVSSGYFAVAGLLCAAGPVLIHLLNRRRFRVVDWAAMDFLFEALRRQKRKLQLRDIILLLLRTAAVLFFGLALARPYFSSAGSLIDANSPRHLIVLLDNSLSMGYRPVDTTLLEQAKRQASQLIESLPDGSQVSIVGACGHLDYHRGPIRRKSDALEFLGGIRLVDGVSRIEDVVSAAQAARGTATPLADQIVYFTDLQRGNWPTAIDSNRFTELPILQIRAMSAGAWDNTWVADVQLRDDVVDLDTPATVIVTVRRHGSAARRTQVSLAVNSQTVATRRVELPPGYAERRIAFECSFSDAPVEPGDASFVPLQVSLSPDRLEQDDQRIIMVPVVTSLPVVFIDQYADENEDPALGQLGETRPLRHLLAPLTVEDDVRPLVDIQHVTISEVNRSLLAPARLVVIAGVSDPGPAIELLRQYVQQGGPLVIATGSEFDPHAWNLTAGVQGAGLLPGLLVEQPLGIAPDEAQDSPLNPFSLSYQSVASDPFLRLPGLSDEELREIYQEPLFFKTIAINLQPLGYDSNDEDLQSSTRTGSDNWLIWKSPNRSIQLPPQTEAEPIGTTRTQVCARFNNSTATPFLVRHRVGKGEVLFVATSILPTWNNLAQTNAIVLWDHVLRSLIRSTLPQRNFLPQDQFSIPVPVREPAATARLERPGNSATPEMIDVGFIQKDQLGVTVLNAWTRGLYRLASANTPGERGQRAARVWQLDLAVNGDAEESDLSPLSGDEIQTRVFDTDLGRISQGNSLGALESATSGSSMWWWLVLAVFVLLASELALLAAFNRRVGEHPISNTE